MEILTAAAARARAIDPERAALMLAEAAGVAMTTIRLEPSRSPGPHGSSRGRRAAG